MNIAKNKISSSIVRAIHAELIDINVVCKNDLPAFVFQRKSDQANSSKELGCLQFLFQWLTSLS